MFGDDEVFMNATTRKYGIVCTSAYASVYVICSGVDGVVVAVVAVAV
jgi:hypothetical protein